MISCKPMLIFIYLVELMESHLIKIYVKNKNVIQKWDTYFRSYFIMHKRVNYDNLQLLRDTSENFYYSITFVLNLILFFLKTSVLYLTYLIKYFKE